MAGAAGWAVVTYREQSSSSVLHTCSRSQAFVWLGASARSQGPGSLSFREGVVLFLGKALSKWRVGF